MKLRNQTTENGIRILFWFFTVVTLIAAIVMPDRGDMFGGLVRICTQSG